MERIDLFDSYIKGELSDAERREFKSRLETDNDFAEEYNAYLLTVRGLCKQAEEANVEFGAAMKRISKDELMDIIGRKPRKMTRDELAQKLAGQLQFRAKTHEYSSAAAFSNSDEDDYVPEPEQQPAKTPEAPEAKEKDGEKSNAMRVITIVFIVAILFFILISLLK